MEQNVFLVKWFGPFKTPEEAEKWEKMNGACQLYLFGEWWKPYVEEVWQRQSKDAPSCHIPDVLCFHYYSDDDKELFGSQKLKRLF